MVEDDPNRLTSDAPVTGTAALAEAGNPQAVPETNLQHQTSAPSEPPLLSESETNQLRGEWQAIQTGFVDEPRHAVEQADELVARAMKRLAEVFASERSQLESQWDQGDNVSTEDLRLALQRYRSFFGRLLSI